MVHRLSAGTASRAHAARSLHLAKTLRRTRTCTGETPRPSWTQSSTQSRSHWRGRQQGGEVVMVLSIVDREEGAVELDIPFEALFKASEFLEATKPPVA